MSAQATARGTLGGTPLSNLLVYGLDRGLTGTLVIEDPERRKCGVRFKDGVPRKVKVSEPIERLGDMLVAAEVCDEGTMTAVFDASRATRVLHGKALVDRGIIDAEMLESTLAEQLARKLEWMTSLGPDSVFGYYDGLDFLEAYGGAGVVVDPLEVIWRVIRKAPEPAALESVLAKLGTGDVRLHPSSRVGRFGFDARERGMLDVVRMKPQPLPELLLSGLLPVPQMKRVLYTLAVTRHLDVGSNARPLGVDSGRALEVPAAASTRPNAPAVAGASRLPVPPSPEIRMMSEAPAPPTVSASLPVPRGVSSGDPAVEGAPGPRAMQATLPPQFVPRTVEADTFRAEVLALSERMGEMSYFEILGVEPDAGSATIQSAFFQLAKKWHPDRIGAEFLDVKDAAARVFARMSEAHQVLADDEQRAAYEKARTSAATVTGDEAVIQRVLHAATSFQKAEILIRRGQPDAAEAELRQAVESDPDQAEYLALHADVLSQKLEREGGGDQSAFVQMVNTARKREPQNLKVRLYRARVLRRAGDADGAVREWKSIVETDPSNVEAAREVRLFEMRRGRKAADPRPDTAAGSGKDIGQFFSKLFKR